MAGEAAPTTQPAAPRGEPIPTDHKGMATSMLSQERTMIAVAPEERDIAQAILEAAQSGRSLNEMGTEWAALSPAAKKQIAEWLRENYPGVLR